MKELFQIVLLPGLGADFRLLESQKRAFPQLIVPAWIEPDEKETLQSYAARMAAVIPKTPNMPLILGGVSFGGMIAYEISRYLNPKAVVLIASCRSRQSLRPIYGAGCWILPWLPISAWDIAKLMAGSTMRLNQSISAMQKNVLVAMFRQSSSRFMHWALNAMLNWNSSPLENQHIRQIHGSCDWLIPVRRIEADEIISNGGHLINVTHADRVNAFLHRVMKTI